MLADAEQHIVTEGANHSWFSKIHATVGSQGVIEHTHKGDVQICQDICPDQHFYTIRPNLHHYLLPNLHTPIVRGVIAFENSITSCDQQCRNS